MQEYYIDCVRRDGYGIITYLGIDGGAYPVMQVVQGHLDGHYLAYTFENNLKAYVTPRKSVNGN